MGQLVNELAVLGWYALQNFEIHNQENKPVFRIVTQFKKQLPVQPIITQNILIKENNQDYSTAFIALLKPYYLHL
jgi:tRNA1(Val) A37 N6-methylase TrmN6